MVRRKSPHIAYLYDILQPSLLLFSFVPRGGHTRFIIRTPGERVTMPAPRRKGNHAILTTSPAGRETAGTQLLNGGNRYAKAVTNAPCSPPHGTSRLSGGEPGSPRFRVSIVA
ncbi:hypothetical protein BU16DRAFT_561840 [Lophium mytilinum]|uniref:Uncharacterized protein n=1 Tax=Lophium mytilinum TaxID=390894 RepID=A0A6A6QUG2_9PEZI|nr:hypothetical protein BU16DRAFT_561840 [Lophium mytilinum]